MRTQFAKEVNAACSCADLLLLDAIRGDVVNTDGAFPRVSEQIKATVHLEKKYGF